MKKLYDSIIIGGGVIGCAVARYLSRYNGSFLVLEKHNDVGDETSSANSAIVHSGYDPKPGTRGHLLSLDIITSSMAIALFFTSTGASKSNFASA